MGVMLTGLTPDGVCFVEPFGPSLPDALAASQFSA